ncbi:MAG: hypothetical protein HKN94_04395 [Acidimicrobiales bacterium]|nr:hypothetical protein [Acidimicrobiales bacterium]RZV45203.1 MAG: hypothetical protein EX269_10515 [Acidimicrobiales bacterium]
MTLKRPDGPRSSFATRERGAVLVITAIAMMILLGVAALAIDLAIVRDHRATGQRATDAAATAGAVTLLDTNLDVSDACQAAVEYLEQNGVADTFTPPLDCTTFPKVCFNGVTPSVTEVATNSSFEIQITYPVDDADPKMAAPSALGAGPQTINSSDGKPCERFGVSVKSVHGTYFGGAIGFDEIETTVHSVALVNPSALHGRALNLLLLERHDCDTLEASGAGGGIIVGGVLNPVTGLEQPGTLTLDSDGTGSGCNNDGTIDVNGTNALIRADGDPCPFELVAGTGQGCGHIEVFATGGPGCFPPACTSAGIVAPGPEQTPTRLTRASVDWIFDCKAPYPASYDIDPCPRAATSTPYITKLINDVGSSGLPSPAAEWKDYSPTYPCALNGSDVVKVPQGNWRVNCKLSLKGELYFTGGNVVFDDDVVLQADGLLDVNSSNTTLNYFPPSDVLDIGESSATAAFAYFRNGAINKAGQSSIRLTNVLTYFSSTSSIKLGGGSGTVAMLAPTDGPFKNLAMWSDSSTDHDLAGQANIALEGVFFTPVATVNYQGNGGQVQVAAQFVSQKLSVGGNGRLKIKPRADRMVKFPDDSTTTLIR